MTAATQRKPPRRLERLAWADVTPEQRVILSSLQHEARKPTVRLRLSTLAGLLLVASGLGMLAGMAVRW